MATAPSALNAGPFHHICIPTDGSEASQRAVALGISLARTCGARLTFVTCTAPFEVLGGSPVIAPLRESYDSATKEKADELLSDARASARRQGLASDAAHVQAMHPWEGILQAAERRGCDAIVMASRGLGAVASLVLGSQAQKVISHSQLPVLVCR